MAIPDEDVARVRAATDLAALVGEHTALKRVGRRFVGLCPFHGERSPSFSVNAEEGLYYCFGCQVSGDAITFVRAVEGCDFVEAVERLAARAGITVRDDADPGAAAERGRRQQLQEVMAEAVAFYHDRLLNHPEAGRARQYLRGRGYDGDVVRQFRLGFAPAGFDELVRSLRRPPALLRAAGLAHDNSRGRLQDTVRERVIFPIFDPAGRPVALGGRVLPPELRTSDRDPGPKYRNSPESPIYQKRRTLYGLNWAKAEVARSGEVVVCEGYTDVIGFFTSGVPRAVATCGTSLTEEHFQLLSRFAKRVVLAFDADKAGQNAAARIYAWERRHELELAVAELPEGADPGDLARESPAVLAQAVAAARPFLGFQVERALSAADLRNPEGRARAVAASLAAVAEHPNELVRDEYLLRVADRTGQDPARLRPLLAEARQLAQRREQESERAPASRERPPRAGAGERQPSDRRRAPSGQGRPGEAGRAQAPAAGSPDEPPPYDDDGRYEDGGLEDEPSTSNRRAATSTPPGEGPTEDAARLDRRANAAEVRSAGGRDGARPGAARRSPEGPRAGRDALLLAVHRPEEVAAYLDAACFVDPLQRAAFLALEGAARLHEAIEHADPPAADLLARLAASDAPEEMDAVGTVVALVRQAGAAALRTLEGSARLAAERGDGAALAEVSGASAWLKGELESLNELGASEAGAGAAVERAAALVAWLAERESQGWAHGQEA